MRPYDLPETALVVAVPPLVLAESMRYFYFLCEMSVEDKNNDNNYNNNNHNDNHNKNNPEQQKQRAIVTYNDNKKL